MVEPEGSVPDHLKDIVKKSSLDPREKIAETILAQRGLLPYLTDFNPHLQRRLIDFFLGGKRLLIIGGESGMGKSLMGADIRTMYRDLKLILPPEQGFEMVVLSYDRAHKTFFNMAETDLGIPLDLPKGETHLEAREIVSRVMSYGVNFALDNLPRSRIILEAPLFDHRGESIIDRLGVLKSQAQTIIMHSPSSRVESLKGRDLKTSGQPDAMITMREKLIYLAEIDSRKLSIEAQDEEIRKYWEKVLAGWDGMVVQWDPEKDRVRYEQTRAEFKKEGIGPDLITPKVVSRYVLHQYEDIFDTLENEDEFLRKITS